jgi:putative DNA primase/helicase
MTLLDAALEYARMGWQVFACHSTGHHPLVKRGFYEATTDTDVIKSWWTRWPDAAIGLRTGQESGMFAIDVDPRHGGDVSMEMLETEHGQLPETVESQTGGGGRHLLFAWPGRPVPCSVGKVGRGIDTRGDGGYIIAPPSDHESGRQYCWMFGQEPGERPMAEAPCWLLKMIEQDAPVGPVASGEPVAGEEIPEGYRNKTLASQAGYMRQIGLTADEIAPALQAINLHRCNPPLEAAEVDRIAASIGRYDPDTCRQAQVECWPERYLGDGTDWPDPQPIPEDLPPVAVFDPVLLPSTVRPWVVDIAERMQCPIEFPAVCAMVALAAIIGRRASIRPLQLDDWTEYVNLWGMLIGRPSMMKSPPMKKVLTPIRILTEAARDEYKAAMKVYERQRELADIEAKQAKRKVEAALAKGEDVETLSDGLVPDLPEKPKRRRYVVNDTTVEALAEVLSENPNGVLVERDEMMGFLQSLERPGQNGAREFYLESWAGNACFESDRIGRGNTSVTGACTSILGSIQPGPLGMYLSEAIRGGRGDDGFMQRFQLSVWPDDPGEWRVVDRYPDKEARDLAFDVFKRLENLNPMAVGAESDIFDESGVPFFHFDPVGQERFNAWMTARENRLRRTEEHPAMESHLIKYRKLIPALSLIIHLSEARKGPVGHDAVARAIAWGDLLETHARRIYAVGIEPGVVHARALAKKIVAGEVADGFTDRDIYRNHWSLLSDKHQVQLAVAELVDLDWLRVENQTTQGRPKVVHRINPAARGMAV